MKKLKILFVVLVPFMLGGCSYMEYPEENVTTGPTLSVSSASVVATTGGTRTTNPISEGSMGIFRLATNGYSAQNNVQYDCIGAEWIKHTEDIYLNNNPATVCAYYPYDSSITNPSSVPLSSQIYDDGHDLCYVNNKSASNSASNVSFNMEHAYARMTFNITRSPNYNGTGLISNVSITNNGLKSSGVLNITNGSYTSETNGTVAFDPGIKSINAGTTVSASVLLIPVAGLSGSLSFSFNVDGVPKNVVLDVGSNGLTTLQAGCNYQIDFTLGTSLVESNCYIVKPNGMVYIPISRANKGWAVAGLGTAIAQSENWTADLLWTDNLNGLSTAGVVQSVTPNVKGGYITVKAGSVTGNAVVEVKNSSGTTVWSWHIWVTNYDPNTKTNGTTYTYNGLTFMDRNLGATSAKQANVTALGLLYQWGRKDPFLSSSSYSDVNPRMYYNTNGTGASLQTEAINWFYDNYLSNAIQNPSKFYTSSGGDWYSYSYLGTDDSLWGGADSSTPSSKTVYDPCPQGWRVPAWNGTSPWNGLSTKRVTWAFGYSFPSAGYYPAAGYLDSSDGSLNNIGSNGYYWTATADTEWGDAYSLFLMNKKAATTDDTQSRATGQSVRCVKEQ